MSRSVLTVVFLFAACIALGAPAPAKSPWVTGWDKPVDPNNDCKFIRDKDTLTIEVSDKNHGLAVEIGLTNAPRLLRDVEGDFVAQVRVQGTFSPDGKHVLSASDPTLRLWNVGTGKEVRHYDGHTGCIHSVAFSPDGKRALSGSADCTVRLWRLPKGRTTSDPESHRPRSTREHAGRGRAGVQAAGRP